MGVDDPYSAWCLDEVVYLWGTHVESEIERASQEGKDEKQKRNKINLAWKRLFHEESEDAQSGGNFKDPMDARRK